jgi:hypothetical protein
VFGWFGFGFSFSTHNYHLYRTTFTIPLS